jgi:hypothetical protein
MTQDTTYTLPVDDGTASQFLQSNGAGVLTWATALTAEADTLDTVTGRGATTANAVTVGTVTSGADGADGQLTIYSEQGGTDYRLRLSPHAAMTGDVDMTGPAGLPAGAAFWKMDASGNITFDTAVYLTAEVDGSLSNEINTITADTGGTTSGLALTLAGGGIAATSRSADTVTITATEADTLATVTGRGGDTTNAITAKISYAAHTSTGNIATASCYGGTITNTGAGGAVVLTLPDAVQGMSIIVILTVAQDVDVNPQNGEQILVRTDAAGDALSSDATVGSYLCLVAVSDTEWMPVGVGGTWTDAD